MFISLTSQFLRLLITSVVSSIPLYLLYFARLEISDSGILFLSFVVFNILAGLDSFLFSVTYWKKEDYFIGQLLPWIMYVIFSIIVYALYVPRLLNILFLPLRFFENFSIKTISSMLISSGALLMIMTVLRIVGSRMGLREYEIEVMENTEM